LRRRLGPLVEREYRLLFSATTITSLGDAVAGIALAFAVLDLTGRATDLGIVIAVRQVANASVLLFGGGLSDRLPSSDPVRLVGSARGCVTYDGRMSRRLDGGDQERRCRLCRRRSGA
jgi:hypothetical protein